MGNLDFFNIYVEQLVNELLEATKLKVLNNARITFLEQSNSKLVERIKELETEIQHNEKDVRKKTKSSRDDNTF